MQSREKLPKFIITIIIVFVIITNSFPFNDYFRQFGLI